MDTLHAARCATEKSQSVRSWVLAAAKKTQIKGLTPVACVKAKEKEQVVAWAA
jgi:hypothetical protein